MPDNSLLQALLQRAQTPITEIPTQVAQAVARPVTDYGMNHAGPLGTAAKYAGAFGENVGDTLTGMTSPIQLALMAASGGVGKVAGKLGSAAMGVTRSSALGAAKGLAEGAHAGPLGIPGLTHAAAEFAPVGGEAVANAARAGMSKIASPGARNVEQTLYKRIMDSGAGNVGSGMKAFQTPTGVLGSATGEITPGAAAATAGLLGAGGYAGKQLYDMLQTAKNPLKHATGILDKAAGQ